MTAWAQLNSSDSFPLANTRLVLEQDVIPARGDAQELKPRHLFGGKDTNPHPLAGANPSWDA